MNTEDVEVGELYDVPGELKAHHFPDVSTERTGLVSPAEGAAWRMQHEQVPGRVLEKGLPYGKRGVKAGVRIEFTLQRLRRCQACGHGWEEDENGEPIYDDLIIEAVIPASMILGRWDQRELRRDLARMETLEWVREKYPERVDGEFDITPEAVIDPDRGRRL